MKKAGWRRLLKYYINILFHLLLFQPLGGRYQQRPLRILLVVLAGIQTLFLLFFTDPNRNDEVDQLEDAVGDACDREFGSAL